MLIMNPILTDDIVFTYDNLFLRVMPDEVHAIDWAKRYGLLANNMFCDNHHHCSWKELRMSNHGTDEFHWRCNNRHHKTRISMRKGSFFEGSKLRIRDISAKKK